MYKPLEFKYLDFVMNFCFSTPKTTHDLRQSLFFEFGDIDRKTAHKVISYMVQKKLLTRQVTVIGLTPTWRANRRFN